MSERWSRRAFLRTAGAAVAALAGCRPRTQEQGSAADAKAGVPRKPNIIFILSDDLSYRDLGCYGQKHIDTPNLDLSLIHI